MGNLGRAVVLQMKLSGEEVLLRGEGGEVGGAGAVEELGEVAGAGENGRDGGVVKDPAEGGAGEGADGGAGGDEGGFVGFCDGDARDDLSAGVSGVEGAGWENRFGGERAREETVGEGFAATMPTPWRPRSAMSGAQAR